MASKKSGGSRAPLLIGGIIVLAVIVLAGRSLMSGGGGGKTAKAYEPPATPVTSSSVKASMDQLKGKVVILDFWATWCGPCRMEIPGFVNLQKKYHDQGLEVVGVSLDAITPQGNPGSLGSFMQKFNINYTILMVNDFAATDGYDFRSGIPTTYIVDREGRISKKHVGAVQNTEAIFEEEVKALL
jgi:thiol-disulfide isomerase/thioredoxin